MKISDIIKNDRDRLFIIDRECFIIYTGSSLEDERPFIRIGNYINMPIALIPHIENIVITDQIVGNPAIEQFNIDITQLAENRYIGSRNIVARYIDFQRIFDLDLKNVTVVDVDRDIPDLSREKLLSHIDSFIGIFYKNGNFRIVHRKNDIFNLEDPEGNGRRIAKIHDDIAAESKKRASFTGSGFVFLNNNPLFYTNGRFTAYQFPRTYYQDFHRLGIDPSMIRDIILPSSNFMNITRLLKWKNSNRGKLKIFCDDKAPFDYARRLFSDAALSRSPFAGMRYESGDGLLIDNPSGSYNLIVRYRAGHGSAESISIGYIKSHSGINAILKEKLDALLVNYSVYEDTNLLFKSTATPIAIVDDRTAGVHPVLSAHPVLRQGASYECQKFADPLELTAFLSERCSLGALLDAFADNRVDEIESIVRAMITALHEPAAEAEPQIRLENAAGALDFCINKTTNRKTSALLKKLLGDVKKSIGCASAPLTPHTMILLFHDHRLYPFVQQPLPTTAGEFPGDEIDDAHAEFYRSLPEMSDREFYLRVIDDRKRLERLLSLYNQGDRHTATITELHEEIEKRKNRYHHDEIDRKTALEKKNLFRKKIKKISLAVLAVITGIALIIAAVNFGVSSYKRHQEAERRLELKRRHDALVKNYQIRVSDQDIYRYANAVALKNGFRPLNFNGLKTKNPNWIYPKNIIRMLDNESLTVKDGDTLWGMSHAKIMKIHLDFYAAVDAIKTLKKQGRDFRREADRARSLVFSDEHKRILDTLIGDKK